VTGTSTSRAPRAPRGEPLPVRGDRPDAREHPVGDDDQGVVDEERRDLLGVVLDLLEGVLDPGGVLELQEADGPPVQEDDDVRPAVDLPVDHRELVHREQVVVVRLLPVHEVDPDAAHLATVPRDIHLDAIAQHPVQRPVVGDERRGGGVEHLPHGLVQGVARHAGIEPPERVVQAPAQHHVLVAVALCPCLAGRDVGTTDDRVAEVGEVLERQVLDAGLGDAERGGAWRHGVPLARSRSPRTRSSRSSAM
jgi:hypothetical protein